MFKKLVSMITPSISSNITIQDSEIVCTECSGHGWEDVFIPCELCNGLGKVNIR